MRPSPVAATSARTRALGSSNTLYLLHLAAPEDWRTPGRTTANRGEGGGVAALVRCAGSPAHRRPNHRHPPPRRQPPPSSQAMKGFLGGCQQCSYPLFSWVSCHSCFNRIHAVPGAPAASRLTAHGGRKRWASRAAASPLCDLRKCSPKRTLTSFGQPGRAGRPRSDCMDSVQLNCQL